MRLYFPTEHTFYRIAQPQYETDSNAVLWDKHLSPLFYMDRLKTRLVVDQFILIAPAVQLSDLLADLLCRMLGSQFSHRTEVSLAACL